MPSLKYEVLERFERLLRAFVVYNKKTNKWGQMASIAANFVQQVLVRQNYAGLHLDKLTADVVWNEMLRQIGMIKHRDVLIATPAIINPIKYFIRLAAATDNESAIKAATIVGQHVRRIAKDVGLRSIVVVVETTPDLPEPIAPAIEFLRTHFPKASPILEQVLVPGYNPLIPIAQSHVLRAMCLEVHPDKYVAAEKQVAAVAAIGMIALNRLREGGEGKMPVSFADIDAVLASSGSG